MIRRQVALLIAGAFLMGTVLGEVFPGNPRMDLCLTLAILILAWILPDLYYHNREEDE